MKNFASLREGGLKAALRAPGLPFVLLWAFMTVCHLLFRMNTGDDPGFAQVLHSQSLWEFSVDFYLHWSGRVLVNIPNVVLNYLPNLVWQLLNPLVITGMAWGLAGLVGVQKNTQACWVLCGFLVLYPWQVMDSAGWITTTAVFLWPCAAAVGALRVLQSSMERNMRSADESLRSADESSPPAAWMKVLAVAGVLYATNNEQLLIILLPLLAVWCAAGLLQKRRVPPALWASLGAAVASLLLTTLSPGNSARLESETVSWMPDAGMKSLFSKTELGASAALDEVFYSRSLVFFFFLVLLAWGVFQRRREWYFRFIALIPLAVCFVFGVNGAALTALWPGAALFTESVTGNGIITLANVNSLAAFVPLVVLYGSLFLVLVCLYLALGHTVTFLGAFLPFGLALASRIAMGFSPTIWTSGPRTSMYWQMATIGVATLLWREVAPGARRWEKWLFWCVFGLWCLVGLFSIQEMRIASGY